MVKIKQSARLTQLCIMLKDDVSDQLMATSVTCISNLKQPMPVYDTHNGKKKKKKSASSQELVTCWQGAC